MSMHVSYMYINLSYKTCEIKQLLFKFESVFHYLLRYPC